MSLKKHLGPSNTRNLIVFSVTRILILVFLSLTALALWK